MPTNVSMNIPFLGGGPQIAEQIMQGLHEGFAEKQQSQQLDLEKKRVQNESQRSNVLNRLTEAQIQHAALVDQYEKETNPLNKAKLLTDLHKSAIELGTSKHLAAYYGLDADAMIKAVSPEGIEPPKTTGTSTAPAGPTPFEQQMEKTEKLIGINTPEERAIWDNAKDVAAKTMNAAPITAAIGKISENRQAVHKAELETTKDKMWFEAFKREHDGNAPTQKDIEDYASRSAMVMASGRGEINNKDFYDSETGSLVQLNANDFNRLNKQDPGRYVEYSGTVANALKAQTLINGIRDISKNIKDTLKDKDFELSTALKSKLSLAARAEDKSLFNTIIGSIAIDKLKPQEMDFLNAFTNLHERAMSMRGLQGQGAGSDAQREAIFKALPGLIDNKELALKRMATFDNEVENLDKGIPKIGKSSKKSAGEAKAGTAAPVTAPKVPSFADWDKQQQPPQP